MIRLRSLLFTFVAAAALLMPGCAPTVVCMVETEVHPDYTVSRVTRLDAYPNPRFQGQRPRLSDYFQFPAAELYDTYVVQQDKVLFAGAFDSFEMLPSDLIRNTPGANSQSGNLFSFRVMDLVLFVLADFDETLTDIVLSQEDGEAALVELLRLAVPEVMSVLQAKYGAKYDMSRLEAWLMNDLPAKLRRVYAGAWAIHSAKRSGVTSPGEDYEFYMFLKAEAKREGLELVEPGHPDMQQENIRRLKEYGIRLAQGLLVPRQGGGITGQELSAIAVDELVAAIQKAITARHGSVNNFVAKIAALVPRAFGAYLTGTMMPIYMLPETSYQYRLRIPGTVIQTNGVRELNGDLMWNFSDRDLAFTGQSLWARTIFVREPAVFALGLRGFPDSLGDVDKLFGLCLTPGGAPREEILRALGQSVAARGTGPLEALAANPQSPDAASAKGILELFERHRQSPAAQSPQQPRQGGTTPPPAQQPAESPQAPPPQSSAQPRVQPQPPSPADAPQAPAASRQPQGAGAAQAPLPSLDAPIPEPNPAAYGTTSTPASAGPSSPPPASAPVPTLDPIQLRVNDTPPPSAAPPRAAMEIPPIPEPEPAANGARQPQAQQQQPRSGGIEPPALPPPVR